MCGDRRARPNRAIVSTGAEEALAYRDINELFNIIIKIEF